MNSEIQTYLEKFPAEITERFEDIRNILLSIDGISITEMMWAKLPSYYCGEKFVRIIPFKDHINIEASGLRNYTGELQAFKFTPKGMMQLRTNQDVPAGVLKKAFEETLR